MERCQYGVANIAADLEAVLGLDRPGHPMFTAVPVDGAEVPPKRTGTADRKVELERLLAL
jgi:hypothetical protein